MYGTETEIEWRHRISLIEAQRILLEIIRGKETVYVEDYRVRNHGEIHRRLGERCTYADKTFDFNSFAEYLDLVGAPFMRDSSTYTKVTDGAQLISMTKLTTCIHTYIFFDQLLSVRENNMYPRIFCCKRSAELSDMCDDDDDDDDNDNKVIDLEQLERFETDRSDNNLGLKFVHKVYFFNTDGIRVCLYSILDEFGSVRYEIGVEKEFPSFENKTNCLKRFMRECSIEIHKIVPFLQYVECPRINLTTGWLNDNNTSNATLRSLSCQETMTKHVKLYETYLNDLLNCDKIVNNDSNFCLIKFKIDGVRRFAVYNGAHHLCLDNGVELDLREYVPCDDDTAAADYYRCIFSTHFVYQLEELENSVYFLTDVLAVRNRYTSIIQPPLYTFASSVQRYKKHAGQEWPFCLIGTDLTKNSALIEQLDKIRRENCTTNNAPIAQNPENQGFVPLTVNESSQMLSAIQRHPAVRASPRFHVNVYWDPKTIYRSVIVNKRFGYYQFLHSYRHLIKLFSQDERDRQVVSRLWEKFQTNMLSSDLKWLMMEKNREDKEDKNFDWFYKLDVPRMFEHIDGLLLFKRQTNVRRRRKKNVCSFSSLLSHSRYEAYKIKTFQTIELMYTEHKTTRWFKTDDFYHKHYIIDHTGRGNWCRFDGPRINLFIPRTFLPLIPYAIYEILCEDENTFYLIKRRTDKTIPDSHYKVNSIVFGRQILQKVFSTEKKKRKNIASQFSNLSVVEEDDTNDDEDADDGDACDVDDEYYEDGENNCQNDGEDDSNEEDDDDDDDEDEEMKLNDPDNDDDDLSGVENDIVTDG